MNKMIYTFWEGKMPAYIKLCLETWKLPYTILNYENLKEYTDFDIESAKRFSLPQIADAVRVHILRDNGGYWLDADTIMIGDKLPEETILGNNRTRQNTIGFLHAQKPHEDFFEIWAEYQDEVIGATTHDYKWDVLGNRFTDFYLLYTDRDIQIGEISKRWIETYFMPDCVRSFAYEQVYFKNSYCLSDLWETDILMLHNSWTPDWYKDLSVGKVLMRDVTLSNILREVLYGK